MTTNTTNEPDAGGSPDAGNKGQANAQTSSDNSKTATTFTPPRLDILKILEEDGHISAAKAKEITRVQRRGIQSIQQALIEHGELSQEIIYRAVAKANNLEFVNLAAEQISDEAIKAVPIKVVMHYKIIPVRVSDGILSASFSDPPAMRDRENLRLVLGVRIQPVISTPADINRATKLYYGLGAETVMQIREDRGFQERMEQIVYDDQDLADETADSASIINLVNQLLLEALQLNATDIHVEPYDDKIQLRYRIDGLLRIIPTPTGIKELHAAIISRLKVMANLNIAEKRLPHDGRIRCHLESEEFDLRVSIIPTRFGETLNLRILNRSTIFYDLDQLGLEEDNRDVLYKLLSLPHGIILVTGPTGSGKTTTLYASLEKTNKTERKVITVEDPIEYQLEGISQIQMYASIGLTFAVALRSILRHDPDIVLVGEIRDAETAEIAIRAALTGHLVLSTLHTNDAIGAINRLIDMAVEPFLLSSSLLCSIAQRLVRRICPHCKIEDDDISDRIRDEIADVMECELEEVQAWKGKGCVECALIGYRGRVAIYEFFLMSEQFEEMIAKSATNAEMRIEAMKLGMRTLRMDGWKKVMKGRTSVEEILRLTSAVDLHY